jgi:hypothetical protein
LFGVVTDITVTMNSDVAGEHCTVTWDDRTMTTQPSQQVIDINWAPPVSLGDLTVKEWLTSFEATHNIDVSNVKPGVYQCSRTSKDHLKNCTCRNKSRKTSKHHILPSCMCNFRITISDDSVQFSGTHAHHIPGTYTS